MVTERHIVIFIMSDCNELDQLAGQILFLQQWPHTESNTNYYLEGAERRIDLLHSNLQLPLASHTLTAFSQYIYTETNQFRIIQHPQMTVS